MSLLRAIDQRMGLAIIPIFKYSNQWQLYRNKYNLGADKVVALPPHDWEVKGSIPASASSPKRAIFISDTHEQQKNIFWGWHRRQSYFLCPRLRSFEPFITPSSAAKVKLIYVWVCWHRVILDWYLISLSLPTFTQREKKRLERAGIEPVPLAPQSTSLTTKPRLLGCKTGILYHWMG